MEELYLLKKQLDDLYSGIPKYERDNNIESPELIEYKRLSQKVIEYSSKLFGVQESMEQIEERILEYSVEAAKELLSHSPEEIKDAMPSMNGVTRNALTRLEYCLSSKRDNERDFQIDELFAKDRDFLARFTDKEIASFESLQNSLKNDSDNVIKK